LRFIRHEHTDSLIGILSDSSIHADLNRSKKERERTGEKELVSRLLPDGLTDWGYEESGKPYFLNRAEDLSFTHCENVYACQVSKTIRCGIDLQHYREKIVRLSGKFLNTNELTFIESIKTEEKVKYLTAMWSAKEVLYKLYGIGFIDYLNKFTIQPFSTADAILQAKADFGQGESLFYIRTLFTADFVLAFHTLSPTLPSDDEKHIFHF